jgi:hypothetical protein
MTMKNRPPIVASVISVSPTVSHGRLSHPQIVSQSQFIAPPFEVRPGEQGKDYAPVQPKTRN